MKLYIPMTLIIPSHAHVLKTVLSQKRNIQNTERALYYADLVGTDMIYIELWDVDEDNRHLIASQSMQVKYAKQFQAWKEFKNGEAYTAKHEKEVAEYYKKRKEMPW